MSIRNVGGRLLRLAEGHCGGNGNKWAEMIAFTSYCCRRPHQYASRRTSVTVATRSLKELEDRIEFLAIEVSPNYDCLRSCDFSLGRY